MSKDKETIKSIQLAQNLNALLTKENITVSVLAKRIGINKTTLHNYCNGVLPRNIQSLIKLANFFKINLNDLIYISESKGYSKKIIVPGERFEVIVREIQVTENENS